MILFQAVERTTCSYCNWCTKGVVRIRFSSTKKKIQKVKFLGAILGAIMQSLCLEEVTIDKLKLCLA